MQILFPLSQCVWALKPDLQRLHLCIQSSMIGSCSLSNKNCSLKKDRLTWLEWLTDWGMLTWIEPKKAFFMRPITTNQPTVHSLLPIYEKMVMMKGKKKKEKNRCENMASLGFRMFAKQQWLSCQKSIIKNENHMLIKKLIFVLRLEQKCAWK